MVGHDEAVPARAVRSDSEGSSDTGFRRKRRRGRAASQPSACAAKRVRGTHSQPAAAESDDDTDEPEGAAERVGGSWGRPASAVKLVP